MNWLGPVRSAFDLAPGSVPVFFRDDDAGWADDRLTALLDRFDRVGVPVDVAVIPTAVHPGLADELSERVRAGGVHVHQHGYRHVNHEPDGRKHEFGSVRSRAAQVEDVLAGRELMLDAFDELVEPVFTPPWNRCTSDTTAAVAAAGLQVLSRDVTAAPLDPYGLVEVPVTIDWFAHRKGVRLTLAELGERIAANVAAGGPVGVMLHHAITDDDELAAVGELLTLVAGHDRASPTTIMEVAAP
jgi:hypothetical protein